MPEIPEITRLAGQMNTYIQGKTIAAADIVQPKCLNIPIDVFKEKVAGAKILESTVHGKWVQIRTSNGWLLLNLGMGGEVLLVEGCDLPRKRRIVLAFTGGACLSINFWWFGYLHFVEPDGLPGHTMTAKLGPNVLDLSAGDFAALLKTGRGNLKSFLLDQARIAGIGNAYIHDILFLARLHPLVKVDKLTPTQVEALYTAVQQGLRASLDKSAAWYEVDLFGRPGGFTLDDILVGYKDGKSCPTCGTGIIKLKTGSTTSYICPNCQKI